MQNKCSMSRCRKASPPPKATSASVTAVKGRKNMPMKKDNYDPTRKQLNFEIAPAGKVCPIDTSRSIPERMADTLSCRRTDKLSAVQGRSIIHAGLPPHPCGSAMECAWTGTSGRNRHTGTLHPLRVAGCCTTPSTGIIRSRFPTAQGQYHISKRVSAMLELSGMTTFQDFDGYGKPNRLGDHMLSFSAGFTLHIGKTGWKRAMDATPYICQNE